ncbi:hypothetical protein AMTRI_Chr06g200050 [Amborella trichopoda]|uniref:DNA repair protein XRCC4 n=1 Tax=Amborella trichopoda TaxID=13333 RepID=W1PZT8_AMBTC|nr:DNA repair protein XRCC4 [Amborella trichopoda]ERN13684.1 hypothetical protein AMTR_s00049p00133960 [Amborella trichopoda]|eukprot:XP_006852217.1 DNA repair protein XRCC4 [Amborella trichopoda]
MEDSIKHSCMRLDLGSKDGVFYIMGTWLPSRFSLSITDGLRTWTCNASEEEVENRANQWDQLVSEYLETAEHYLGFQQPGSVYAFTPAGDENRRLSWAYEKQGTKLEWRWKCEKSSDDKKVTASILDFLMEANTRLSDEVVRNTRSFERMKVEAEKCLAQSERFNIDKAEFESAAYAKFVAVLNSKKMKLRDLRDRLSKTEHPHPGKLAQDEDDSSEKTQAFNGESDKSENSKAP